MDSVLGGARRRVLPRGRWVVGGAALGVLIAALLLARALVGLTEAGSEPGEASEARLVFVGDLMVGRYVGVSMERYGYDAPFEGVKGLVLGADVAVGNLEGALAASGVPEPSANEARLVGDVRAAKALAGAGFDLLSLANNHSLDAGAAGFVGTRDALQAAGVQGIGIAQDGRQAAVMRDVRGVRLAFLAYTAVAPNGAERGVGENVKSVDVSPAVVDGGSEASVARFSGEIGEARKSADVVVVVMHWGTEYAGQPDAGQKRLAEAAARAGADLVVGAHPHVAQGMERIGGVERQILVAYSLGNALFDQGGRAETREGLALSCVVDKRGVKSARLVPLEIESGDAGYRVRVVDDAAGQAVIERAAASTPEELRWKAVWSAGQEEAGAAIAYRREDAGANRSSEEELGMAEPAIVELRDGALTVREQGGGVVWRSDPGWNVTGYTVGDADGDGRPELVYTLWKKRLTWERPEGGGMKVDVQGGDMLPHIYINGWRDGEMRPVWHGSPRPAPVLGVAVVNVGQGGKPLLATLESSDAKSEKAPRHVRLWAWTGGFGFELAGEAPGMWSVIWGDGGVLVGR